MIAQQFAQDYHLFFDREGERWVGSLFDPLGYKILGGEISLHKERETIETDLRDGSGNHLGRKARMIPQDNKSEVGMEARITKNGDLEVLFSEAAFNYFSVADVIAIPLVSGDGSVRIRYSWMPPFNFS